MFAALCPFLLLEFSLRVAGIPVSKVALDRDPLVDLHQLSPLFEIDEDPGQYQIPDWRMNFFRPATFAVNKAANTKRIFVLGGSTVQGRPYATETAFSTWLQLSLQAADSETRFEVINCGGVSYASYRVAKILDEVLQYSPDAIVICTGHNEFLEDRSYAAIRELGSVKKLASQVGSNIQIVRWLQSFGDPVVHADATVLQREVNARLDHANGMQAYNRDKHLHASVLQHFEVSVNRMLAATKAAGVPTILCVPASDVVNTPPFKSSVADDLSVADQDRFGQLSAESHQQTRSLRQRISAAQKAFLIDKEHAGINYLLAMLMMENGDNAGAIDHFVLARDHDVCPLRAPSEFGDFVRRAAKKNGLPLIDIPRLFDSRSLSGASEPDGIADAGLFADHIHPTIAGHQLIGQALAKQFASMGWIEITPASERTYQQNVRKQFEKLDESYFLRGKQRLEGLRNWAAGRAL